MTLTANMLSVDASAGLTASVGSGGVIDVSDGTVDMVFDPAQEGGLAKLYDLATDPSRTVNIGPPAGYSVFDLYVNDAHGWANIGRGQATTLELLRNTPSSVVVHAVGSFMHEDGSGALVGLKHETWTTIYPGGHVFLRRHVITGAAAVTVYNFGGKALDVSPASTWNAIFTGVPTDTSYPSGINTSAGNGSEGWLGFWQAGAGPGQRLSVGLSSWQTKDFGFTYKDLRLLVGNASSRSHEAQRTETSVTLGANSTYSSQFAGWLSPLVRSATMTSELADYRSPSLTVSSGTLATSDNEPVATALTNGYNPATGSYVLSSTSTGVALQLQFPAGVQTRFRPAFKLTGWPGGAPVVQLGGSTLTAGVDYLADPDATAGAVRLVFLKDVVAGAPQAGQLQSGALAIAPLGTLPSPSPTPSPSSSPSPTPSPTPSPSPSPSPSPTPSPSPSPSPGPPPPSAQLNTIVGTGTIEVNDGSTFAVIFDQSQEGGISRVYDLATDPGRTVNIGPAAGYTVFDTYVSDSAGWANIGRGSAKVLEVTRGGGGSVVVHAVGAFMHEDGSGAVAGLQHETWTTIYPGGHVFVQRRLTTGASAVSLSNFGGKAIDLSSATGWNAIFTGVASDTTYPSGTNTTAGNGSEGWLGFWQAGGGAGQSLGVGVSSWQNQDFGFAYKDLRLLVGNASSRSHEAQRTEGSIVLGANSTFGSQFSGWLSPQVRSASMSSELADYRSPSLTVTSGTLATSDSEPAATALTNGYNPGTGSYVLSSTSSGVALQLQFPAGVQTRFRPAFKLTGWPTTAAQVQLGGVTLTQGVDYLADLDASTGTLRIVLLKDVVQGAPGSGQLQNGAMTIAASGSPLPSPSPVPTPSPSPSPTASPTPTPTATPSPTPSPVPHPTPGSLNTIIGTNTIEVNDGKTFAAIFDRNQAGGISQLYDLATDPGRTANLGPQPGYSVFNSYLLDQQVYAPTTSLGVWGELGEGPATTFDVSSQSPESVTIHVVSPYYCEQVDAPGGTCFLNDVTAESWTTIYPGGHVFFERHIITGSTAHTLVNAAPASVDLCL